MILLFARIDILREQDHWKPIKLQDLSQSEKKKLWLKLLVFPAEKKSSKIKAPTELVTVKHSEHQENGFFAGPLVNDL